MKVYLSILTICLLCSLSASAQVRLGVKGGVNISKVHLDKDVFDENNLTGFQVGPVLEVMFLSPFGIEVAALYSQRGLKAVDANNNSYETRTNYIDVPLNLKFRFGPMPLKFYLAAGPYVSFKISGDDSINGIYQNVSDQWEAQTFQAGINAGGGIEVLKFIQLGVNYEYGITDNYSSKDYNSNDRTWSVTATLFF